MKERIIEFLKAENKTSAQLAEEIGVQPSGISHIISGRNNPSLDFILKMLDKYQFLSTDWLLFGKGNMYKEPEMQRLFDDSENIEAKNNIVQIERTKKPDEKDAAIGKNADYERKREAVVEKIVWFFSDSSFKEYIPGRD